MTQPTLPRTAVALAIVALVAACGGESPSSTAAEPLASTRPHAAGTERMRSLATAAATTPSITNAQLFQWARLTYPELFPGTPTPLTIPFEGKVFDVQSFPNGNYLGVANGEAYGYGPFVGGVLHPFGPMQQYADMVCSKVTCTPTGGGGGGSGSLNECMMPASQALQSGAAFHGVYASASFVPLASTGEYTVDTLVNGAVTFEGLPAVKLTSKIVGRQLGFDLDNTTFSYHQAGEGDLTKTLGIESELTIAGFLNRTKSVNSPADQNTEFTLQLGGSLTKSVTATTTTTIVGLPISPPPTTATTTQTHKFEARESVTVLGKSYDTCRYRSTSTEGVYSLQWHIVGKGVTARVEAYTASGTLSGRSELKNGTLNGAAI